MGLTPLWVQCAINEHDASLYSGLGDDQFGVGRTADNISNPCFVSTVLGAPGEAAEFSLAARDVEVSPLCGLCVHDRASQLPLPLSVAGLSLVPAHEAWTVCPGRCPWLSVGCKDSCPSCLQHLKMSTDQQLRNAISLK